MIGNTVSTQNSPQLSWAVAPLYLSYGKDLTLAITEKNTLIKNENSLEKSTIFLAQD